LRYRVIQSRPVKGYILCDELIELTVAHTQQAYPKAMRRVVALVEVDGKQREMVFLTNHFEWAASSVADLYRCRWQIEVFFKQLKQTLQLADFLGHNQNAVTWQIWTALLLYILLRFISFLHRWTGSFSRLFTLLRATLWSPRNLDHLLLLYGTASAGKQRIRANTEAAFLPGLIHYMTT
jgi:IS4 transposase